MLPVRFAISNVVDHTQRLPGRISLTQCYFLIRPSAGARMWSTREFHQGGRIGAKG
jgi:hypothetical protein